jgi:hypothetical protein
MRRTLPGAVALALVLGVTAAAHAQVRLPSQFLGIDVGADRTLADYRQITSYFQHLATQSPRVELDTIGTTTNGNPFIMAVISTPQNLANKARYRDIARQLADPRSLSRGQIETLVHDGKAIVLVTCNIHSTEIASSQMAMEWAHALATASDSATVRRLNDVIVLLVPSLNPDGQIMVTEWYRKYVGTPYEGGSMPWLYHVYTGHDNNRDWYMLTQKETRAMTRVAYEEWHPQVWLDEHQMGSTGPRLFVPPYADPIAPSISPLMWRGINLIGSNMAWRLQQQGKSGVATQYSFDAYYPGSVDSNAEFKNIFSLIIEAASARIASPLDLDRSELAGGAKGLIDYTVTTTFPDPWPGGTWRLRDIMDYQRIATDAMLETVADHAADYIRGTVTMAQQQIAAGRPDEFWRIPRAQRDPATAARLAHLLDDNAIEVLVTPTDFLVPTAQPYGKYAAELLGVQRYPEVRLVTDGPILTPYDVTTWSLPLLMGVDVRKENVPASESSSARRITDADWPRGGMVGNGRVIALRRDANNAFRVVNDVLRQGGSVSVASADFEAGGEHFPAGTFILERSAALGGALETHHVTAVAISQRPASVKSLDPVRVGLYKPWNTSMDEGWTRWVLEQYGFAPRSVDNRAVSGGNLRATYDAILLPDVSADIIVDGRRQGRSADELPPEYAGGIGKAGVRALRDFVDAGGTLITLGSSGEIVIGEFGLGVRNALARVPSSEFSVPGSLLRATLETGDPVNYGMSAEAALFVDDAIAYQTSSPAPGVERSVIATYPSSAADMLLSGWARGLDKLEHRAAAVSFQRGKGKVVMFGFRVQNRAQTEGTFKMLFNAITWAGTN